MHLTKLRPLRKERIMSDEVSHASPKATAAQGTPTPVVLGGERLGLGIVRGLAQAGLRSVVVVDGKCGKYDVAAASRHARRFLITSFDGDTFVEELLRLRMGLPNGGVLICAGDPSLWALSRYRDHLAPYFRFQLPPHEVLLSLIYKESFFQLAQRSGFPVPGTVLLNSHSDLGSLRDLRPPLCVKPNYRTPAYDNSFQKAYRVESEIDARSLCERVLDMMGEVLIQEWIEGPNDSIYFSLCCMDNNPAPVAFTGRKARSWPPHIGMTASCWAAPEVAEELEDLTIRFFRQAGVTSGLASMEFKRDQRDGRFLMIEPTVGRVDFQEEIAALCGINLYYVAYCDAAGLPRPPLQLDPTHVWRNEFTDFRSARMLGISCSYPPGQRIHNALWRWDDPAPILFALSSSALWHANNALRRVTGKQWPKIQIYTQGHKNVRNS
jgi:D-aspartate ligase